MKLFDEINRNYLGPKNYNENTYNFYNRSNQKRICLVREKLNTWFDEYPESEKKSLKGSFKKSFDDSFYELFLFQLFKHLDFQITIHPILEHTTKRPDFLLKKGDLEIYVEAKISKDKSSEEEGFEKMQNEFYDIINKLNSDKYMLAIEEIEFKSRIQPKAKNVIAKIEEFLSGLDHTALLSTKDSIKNIQAIKFQYEDDDLRFVLNPIAIENSNIRESDKRPIGMFPFEAFTDGGEKAIKESVDFKAKRYGELEKPFIVCINALGKNTTSREDVDNAIWGSLAMEFWENGVEKFERWIRMRDGVFCDEQGPKRENLTGVFITQVSPTSIPNGNYWMYENPYSNNPIDFRLIGLKTCSIKNGLINSIDGDDLDTIFNISKTWLQ